jgi:threonine synthase
MLLDPHTAVGLAVSRRFARPGVPMVTLATAHPAKFPEAVMAATGKEPALPERLDELLERPERFTTIANNQAEVARFIAGRTRAATEKV